MTSIWGYDTIKEIIIFKECVESESNIREIIFKNVWTSEDRDDIMGTVESRVKSRVRFKVAIVVGEGLMSIIRVLSSSVGNELRGK